MLKTALFDCTINEKCCSVHGGIQGKKMANARGLDRRGGGGGQLELTDALNCKADS